MPTNLAGAAGAWATARQRGVSPKTFADLLSIEPEIGPHIDAARAAGHDDQTILDSLGGALPNGPDVRAAALTKLARINDLPDDQRSFARFDTRDDYGPLGVSARDIDRLDESDGDRDANVGEYERWDVTDNPLRVEIIDPAHRRLRKEWEDFYGRDWPTDSNGRKYDVAHIEAKADGGKNELHNIRALPRGVHIAEHKLNGDSVRFPQRGHIAQGFGGKVVKPGQSPGKITEPSGPFTPRSTITRPPRPSVAPPVFGPNGAVRVPGLSIPWTGDLHPSGGVHPAPPVPRGAVASRPGLREVGAALPGAARGLSVLSTILGAIPSPGPRKTFEDSMVEMMGPAGERVYRRMSPKYPPGDLIA